MPENAETKEPEQVIKLRLATGENVDYVTSAILSGLRPPPDMTISEWAAKFRVISGASSSSPGQ